MKAATRRRTRYQTHGDGDGHSENITLPCILDRLSRLEHEGFSYDELLHNFASQRRVCPVNEELPVKHVLDPAEETDEIVQVREHASHPHEIFDRSGCDTKLLHSLYAR